LCHQRGRSGNGSAPQRLLTRSNEDARHRECGHQQRESNETIRIGFAHQWLRPSGRGPLGCRRGLPQQDGDDLQTRLRLQKLPELPTEGPSNVCLGNLGLPQLMVLNQPVVARIGIEPMTRGFSARFG